ncbi:MAG: SdiA-regulated domain-containing protein [Pedobacter sp.]
MNIFTNSIDRICLFMFLLLTITLSCKNDNRYSNPAGYDLKAGEKFNMPSSLLEISGIAFNKANSDTVYSIQDEDGKVYKQKWDVKKQKNTKFASKGDFEDLTIIDNSLIVLKSNGSFYMLPLVETDKKETKQVKEVKDLIPKAEYESIYADEQSKDVFVLCKSCPQDKKNKQVTGYQLRYDALNKNLDSIGTFVIDLKPLPQLNRKLKATLSPSAIAKNSLTSEWYILSSANKLLVVTDLGWKVKAVHKLNSTVFNQPEGLAFDSQNNLFISNEGDEITDGNIIKFKYVKQTNN